MAEGHERHGGAGGAHWTVTPPRALVHYNHTVFGGGKAAGRGRNSPVNALYWGDDSQKIHEWRNQQPCVPDCG